MFQNFPSHKNIDISGNAYEHFDFFSAGETPLAVGQPSELPLTGSGIRGRGRGKGIRRRRRRRRRSRIRRRRRGWINDCGVWTEMRN